MAGKRSELIIQALMMGRSVDKVGPIPLETFQEIL